MTKSKEMGREINLKKFRGSSASLQFVVVVILVCSLLLLPSPVHCQDDDDDGDDSSTSKAEDMGYDMASSILINTLGNYTVVFKDDILKNFGFCITDVDADWDKAFNFTDNPKFISQCAKKTSGLLRRVCTAAEIKFYFSSFFSAGAGAKKTYLQPNKNCNLSTWVPGCEPGWGCSVEEDVKVDFKNSKDIPIRTTDCSTCCEGFFCPHGLTCMIPCPLGAYCPMAKLNTTTGVCDPYHYQLPPAKPNHTCGGADRWADILSSSEVFCTPGSYCPTNVQKTPCRSGHYCRTGSTAEEACYRWATCVKQSSNQNITFYGILFFAALSFLLVILYNCSDQVLATREKRQAQTREKARESVRETAQAREKWKNVKKQASALQNQLSRTFSRTRSKMQRDTTKGLSKPKPGTDAALPPMPGNDKGKKKGKGNLTQMLHEIENNPESNEGFDFEIGDKNLKNNAPRGKQLHTQSQMFRYAYGQIEKEKAMEEQNKNLTFSGVISMANDTDMDLRKRPTLEVSFKDLTITLKKKNKHLLRSVTGKLSPGRVSAVMGPSGAGKTTFLSALTGKISSGCIMSGLVLVNGKMESIQAYRKITGFVPQDDIVHGNLTVEENLWFSARCRLSADLDKAEKVLVVERVIEALGLQGVRYSIVGTVEKRGISGGQRKRVNVGLEMVMEPSLLILDEPTSGLDSSSSQLLLRALRREALEGVNVCMVVHQPSYTLFKMFDDLILLAKGGLIAYLGSVKKVEEYFAGLGITAPERVNPPDYYIDILEGITKSSGVDYKQLPLRWMLHNGYAVPLDMLDKPNGSESSVGGNSVTGIEIGTPSAAGEFSSAGANKEDDVRNLLKRGDLSLRKTPGIFQQYKYFLGRIVKQRLREAKTLAVDYLILLLAGICLGTLAKVSDETFGVLGYTYTVIAVSLLSKIAALRSFSLDKLHYWRERSSGMSSLAHFLAKDTLDHFNTIIKPLVYLSMFYFFNNPRSSVFDNYYVLICLVYCVTGMAYILAILLEPGPAQLWSVLLPVVLTLIATHTDSDKFVQTLADMCYTKWALEAFVISNAKRYSGVWLITRCGSLMQNGYDLKHWARCLVLLIVTGIASRVVAFIVLLTVRRK